MGYKYKVKVVYPSGYTEMVGTNNIYYARWIYKSETEAGNTCTFYEDNGDAYVEKII